MILPRRHAVVAALAGTVAGMLAAAALVASGSLERAPDQAQPIEELLTAYRRSREGTYVVEATFTRTMPDGRQLGSAALVVQRPPDSLRRQLGSVTGTLQGRSLNCTSATDGRLRCAPTGEVRPWQEQVDRDVEVLKSYFDPAYPLYRVRRDGEGCFVLDQDRPYPDPTYGARSRMCFDPTTGAMTLLELTRETGAVDRFEAATVRGDVSEADLRVEADQAYDARDEAGNVVGGVPGGG
ncbi:hypothetical protein [Rhabdothermincola sediminis]|uniref:hypothetical protein n=1 Tax=Rhabdothermincola sediminis TaxID=2751370 RepID=UPI001AA08A15|nr:hypothetical protein [Rhabdothermincola sediminis]